MLVSKKNNVVIGTLAVETITHNGETANAFQAVYFGPTGERTSAWCCRKSDALEVVKEPFVVSTVLG
jgi:hypothetical protein